MFSDESNLRFYLKLDDGRELVSCHKENAVLIVQDRKQVVGRLQADFAQPEGLALGNGRLYVVDRHHHCVQMFDPVTLEHLGSFGSQGQADGQLNQPVGIAVSEVDGRIWVADNENHRVQAFKGTEHDLTLGSGYGSAPGQMFCPCGVALLRHSSHGELVIVSEWGGGRVQVFKEYSSVLTILGGVPHAHHVAVDGKGDIYVSEYATARVKRFALDGEVVSNAGSVVSLVPYKNTKGIDVYVMPKRLIASRKRKHT